MAKYYQAPISITSLAPDIREQFEGWLSYRMGYFVPIYETVIRDDGKLGFGKKLVSDNFMVGRESARDNALAELNAID